MSGFTQLLNKYLHHLDKPTDCMGIIFASSSLFVESEGEKKKTKHSLILLFTLKGQEVVSNTTSILQHRLVSF